MKKLYLLLFCLSSLAVNAQPNITVSDLPVVGLAFTMGTDSLFTGTIPAAGSKSKLEPEYFVESINGYIRIHVFSRNTLMQERSTHRTLPRMMTKRIPIPTLLQVRMAFLLMV
ncbi:MAG: hypothetical protein IPG90_05955 [Bacteroidetes bacterium]|nr:hypothetical protein [Bacteroidota bacterium]